MCFCVGCGVSVHRRWWHRRCGSCLLQVEKLILNDMLPAMVAFCRTSTHVEITRLFPLFSAYLCIYVDEDTIPDLLMSWCVFFIAVFRHYLLKYFVSGVVSVVCFTYHLKAADLLLSVKTVFLYMKLVSTVTCCVSSVMLISTYSLNLSGRVA